MAATELKFMKNARIKKNGSAKLTLTSKYKQDKKKIIISDGNNLEKAIFNFSSYKLSNEEKSILCTDPNF